MGDTDEKCGRCGLPFGDDVDGTQCMTHLAFNQSAPCALDCYKRALAAEVARAEAAERALAESEAARVPKPCVVNGCSFTALPEHYSAEGMCASHYVANHRHGVSDETHCGRCDREGCRAFEPCVLDGPCPACEAEAECQAHAVDWRARALSLTAENRALVVVARAARRLLIQELSLCGQEQVRELGDAITDPLVVAALARRERQW